MLVVCWHCSLWHLTHEPILLEQAQDVNERWQAITGKPSYNFGCVFALLGNEEECRLQLLRCREAKTLPNSAHLSTDIDLTAYRDKDWFKDFLKDSN